MQIYDFLQNTSKKWNSRSKDRGIIFWALGLDHHLPKGHWVPMWTPSSTVSAAWTPGCRSRRWNRPSALLPELPCELGAPPPPSSFSCFHSLVWLLTQLEETDQKCRRTHPAVSCQPLPRSVSLLSWTGKKEVWGSWYPESSTIKPSPSRTRAQTESRLTCWTVVSLPLSVAARHVYPSFLK